MKKAVILAGGYGTRLRPLTFTTPKAMIPLVNKPIIEYILDYLISYGLKDIVITTNYLREQTINYLSSKRSDLKLAYPEEPSPLGTAGSVKNAAIGETSFIIQGDNITDIDLKKVMAFHEEHGRLVTIALLPVPNPSLYGIAEIEANGRIRNFKEKPSPSECFSNLANTGLYIIEPEAMEYVPENSAFDFSKDLFPILVAKREVYGCVVNGFWTDIGNPEGYMEASRWILEKKGFECVNTAEIEDNEIQGNVAIGESAVVKKSLIRGPAVIGNHAEIIESKIYDSVIFSGVSLRESIVNKSVIGENTMLKRAEVVDSIIGAYCEIKEGVQVKQSRIPPFTNLQNCH